MTISHFEDINNFFSGHLVTNQERKIVFFNAHILSLSGQPEDVLINTPISQFISKASNIYIDSYVYPLLLNDSVVKEMQITWIGKNGKKIPVVVSIKQREDGMSYWSIYECGIRDKLQCELLKANEQLEKQSQELLLLAITDPLTGLINRRELRAQANKIIHQAARNSTTFALLSIDIDYFKCINDRYGHQAGDKLLIELSKILKDQRRINDVVARVGGEEFIMLLSDINEVNAFRLAENLRKLIENQLIDDMNITVSIGLVVSHKNIKVDLDILLKLSDDALYVSKNNGRNRTSIAQL
jgi:sigma-B regulation protein RsbQ